MAKPTKPQTPRDRGGRYEQKPPVVRIGAGALTRTIVKKPPKSVDPL